MATKAYVAVFVCFSVKAVHLEAVSKLTTSAFIATLRRFIARRGTPTIICRDHGTNFCGATKEIQELLRAGEVSEFYTNNKIEWSFIPEHAPHFGGLWEAAVKSFKAHLRRVVGEIRLTFEELTNVLIQIEACLNSRRLTPLPEASGGLDELTPGHFLIGRPITSLPDLPNSYPSTSLLHWGICVRHLLDTSGTAGHQSTYVLFKILQMACTYMRSQSWRYHWRQRRAYGANEMASFPYRSDLPRTRREG